MIDPLLSCDGCSAGKEWNPSLVSCHSYLDGRHQEK